MEIDVLKLKSVYSFSSENWGDLANFKGDYINFGLWENSELNSINMSLEKRIEGSKNLYKKIIQELKIDNEIVAEIGCGRGMGISEVLPLELCKKVYAIDISADQLARAEKNVRNFVKKEISKVCFLNTSCENTGIPDRTVDKIYSIEVVQHLSSIDSFAKEMWRIMKDGKNLVFTSYFSTGKFSEKKLGELFPLVEDKLENFMTIDDIIKKFLSIGFKKISCEAIGKNVFYGYDKWIKQNHAHSYDYYTAYINGYIDYYIFNVFK